MSYNSYEDLSRNEIIDLLRQWRENNERKGEEVLTLFDTIIPVFKKLGSEKYVILEQVIYAALDCHYYETAMWWIMLLNMEFPGSLRVMRYKAACLEAEEKYDEALELLDNIIKSDETNAAARKRRVCILKAQGLITDAIKELVDYLKKFMSDMEAWQELSELYLQVQEYSKAAFCAEELILHQPHNHLMHQRLADIRYTMGGIENLELAKSYYCQALKLNPDNTRATLGLFLVTNALVGQYKSSGGAKRADAWRLSQWAQRGAAPDLSAAMQHLAITD
ncbi:ER membrane protein complex subunit 2-like [Maniola jurtina]|uniref:ER membrane protein complex subunit 2-like n=1 Tax=Maniola jurtina TaxID=191418 RepID=UPI001E68AB44|nr:ER membrane protein complex subunit 2-like [Maniola jurtina]XP_045767334.1 ER membrane protein complex subunit 2-like [Maniola jurtina]